MNGSVWNWRKIKIRRTLKLYSRLNKKWEELDAWKLAIERMTSFAGSARDACDP